VHEVVAVAGAQHVGRRLAREHVIAGTAVEDVRAEAAEDVVATVASE